MNMDYHERYNGFQWDIPSLYNIAYFICDRHPGGNPALIHEDDDGSVTPYSFGDLRKLSNRLANALSGLGLGRGDRIAILLSQRPETLIAHLAGFKMGAVNVPLFTLFGPDALEYRLHDCGAKAVFVDGENLAKILEIRPRLESLQHIVRTGEGERPDGVISFTGLLENAADEFGMAATSSEDPALIIYTSGTTGPPKGALHAHRVLAGHLPGVAMSHNSFPQPGDRFWTPADWAWIGGLIDVLFPSLYHGVPVLACRLKKYDPEKALSLMAKHRVKNVFLPPTALKMTRPLSGIKEKFPLGLRTVASGGEPLGTEILEWGRTELGLDINEFYGQTEANLLISNFSALMAVKPGSMGRPVFGHRLSVVDREGHPLPAGSSGEIAVKKGDPVMFLSYWKDKAATAEKFRGEWMLTGDAAHVDHDGYFWFSGRKDDVITSAGYRIGPSEIEDCLLKHPAVAVPAVIGSPDEIRGQVVKAFIKLKEGYEPSSRLAGDIKEFVRVRLAAHEYPREVEFIAEIPVTVTGKIKRGDLRKLDTRKEKGW
jgi:acetyl-CoA synthetase